MTPDARGPAATLAAARAAARNGSDAEALALYEHFFDHALDGDAASFYGVRLSYCLNEWAALGARYAPARIRLEERQLTAWKLFEESHVSQRFHDFVAICRALGRSTEATDTFRELHSQRPTLARKVAGLIWRELVAAAMWDVCNAYMEVRGVRYTDALERLDFMTARGMSHSARDSFVDHVLGLARVLRNNGREQELASLLDLVARDLETRNCPELMVEIRRSLEDT